MDDTLKPIIDMIPEKWRTTVMLLFFVGPYITRGLYALRSGTGLVGFFRSILFGTNTPKPASPKIESIAGPQTVSDSIAGPLTVLLLAGLMLCATGCGTVTVKEGSDPVIVHSEWLAENSLNSVDQFLRWERENEAALLKAKPGLNLTANHLRRTFPEQVKALRVATKRYAVDKSNAGQVAALSRAVLDVANQVRTQMGLPPLTLPDAKPRVRDQMKNAPTNAPNI